MGRKLPEPLPRADVTALIPDVHRSRARMARLAALIAAGVLRPPEIVTMPLSKAAEAHRLTEDGHLRGKLVFVPG